MFAKLRIFGKCMSVSRLRFKFRKALQRLVVAKDDVVCAEIAGADPGVG